MDNAPAHLVQLTDKVTYPQFFPLFEETVFEETAEYRIIRGVDGIVCREKKDGSSVPQFLSFPISDPDDWSAVKPLLDPDIAERYASLTGVGDYVRGDEVLRYGICGGYGFLRSLFGTENLSYAYYDYPHLLHDMMSCWLRLYTGIADRVCSRIDFDYVFIWEDMAYKTGPLISPNLFREFILPYYRDFTNHMRKEHGLKIFCVDSDGNNFVLMDLMIEGGITMFLPCEIAAGMDPELIREKYPHLVIYGGIDKREIAKGRESIKAEVLKKVPRLVSAGGYFPALDHHVPPDISFDNFLYFLELVRTIGS